MPMPGRAASMEILKDAGVSICGDEVRVDNVVEFPRSK